MTGGVGGGDWSVDPSSPLSHEGYVDTVSSSNSSEGDKAADDRGQMLGNRSGLDAAAHARLQGQDFSSRREYLSERLQSQRRDHGSGGGADVGRAELTVNTPVSAHLLFRELKEARMVLTSQSWGRRRSGWCS